MYTVYHLAGVIVKGLWNPYSSGRKRERLRRRLSLSTGSSIDLFRFPISGRYIQFILVASLIYRTIISESPPCCQGLSIPPKCLDSKL